MACCRMELTYMDPDVYTAVSTHTVRQSILNALFRMTYNSAPVTKQQLADEVGIGYQQLVYQLNNQIRDFWKVVKEEKIRGTRMEYIAPVNQDAVYMCIGKDRRIYVVDPIAELYGPLDEVGARCDFCSVKEAEFCVQSLIEKHVIPKELTVSERETLSMNRRSGLRPLDRGFIEALKGIASGDGCVLTIPCERCTFLRRRNLITIE